MFSMEYVFETQYTWPSPYMMVEWNIIETCMNSECLLIDKHHQISNNFEKTVGNFSKDSELMKYLQ